ncbi:MAG: type I glyceraldehyde-3-phosphate dehydrogenase [Gammaproteobacteria bacterium]|nr:MAG: type I glyceraldehyde-3-phosphate dehydrogenase [Gammaproteobacteria bacterium]
MAARVAINGLGRIGRATLKLTHETPDLELVAVNDVAAADNLAYLLQYDSFYGRYPEVVRNEGDELLVGSERYRVLNEEDPARLPWAEMCIDLVFDCTGVFTRSEDLAGHLTAGARKVILSAPAKGDGIPFVVHGVNEAADADMVSCASCTTNCSAPVMEVIGRRIGLTKAIMTTIHAYTVSQPVVDTAAKKWRRGRAAAVNFVPTTTGAAEATARTLPQFENRFDGIAIRAPVPVGSLVDITLITERATSVEEVNRIFEEEAATARYDGILGVTHDQIVSSDIIQDPRASIVDLTLTRVVDGDLVKIMSWYDNEWGYAAQMIRMAERMIRS